MNDDSLTTADTLEQVSHAVEPVRYVPHGPHGQWPAFLTYAGDTTGWDVPTALRAMVAYMFDKPATPMVITTFHDTYADDTPSYKLVCYDVTYDELLNFDAVAQPSWFNVIIQPNEALYSIKLSPTRSLMKLIYKLVI